MGTGARTGAQRPGEAPAPLVVEQLHKTGNKITDGKKAPIQVWHPNGAMHSHHAERGAMPEAPAARTEGMHPARAAAQPAAPGWRDEP